MHPGGAAHQKRKQKDESADAGEYLSFQSGASKVCDIEMGLRSFGILFKPKEQTSSKHTPSSGRSTV
jgi:hypothetical protein